MGLFELKPEFSDQHSGLLVAYSAVSPISSGRNTTIQLLNLTAAPVILYANKKVGKLFPLQEADSVKLVWTRSHLSGINQSMELILGNVQGLKVSILTLKGLEHSCNVISVGDGNLGRSCVLFIMVMPHPFSSKLTGYCFICEMVQGMLEQGKEPSESAWVPPIIFVKKDSSFWFCVDFIT